MSCLARKDPRGVHGELTSLAEPGRGWIDSLIECVLSVLNWLIPYACPLHRQCFCLDHTKYVENPLDLPGRPSMLGPCSRRLAMNRIFPKLLQASIPSPGVAPKATGRRSYYKQVGDRGEVSRVGSFVLIRCLFVGPC